MRVATSMAVAKRSKTTWMIDNEILQQLRYLALDDGNKPVQDLVNDALKDYLFKRKKTR